MRGRGGRRARGRRRRGDRGGRVPTTGRPRCSPPCGWPPAYRRWRLAVALPGGAPPAQVTSIVVLASRRRRRRRWAARASPTTLGTGTRPVRHDEVHRRVGLEGGPAAGLCHETEPRAEQTRTRVVRPPTFSPAVRVEPADRGLTDHARHRDRGLGARGGRRGGRWPSPGATARCWCRTVPSGRVLVLVTLSAQAGVLHGWVAVASCFP